MPEIYKIRNAAGLFSTGGTYPNFNARGKSWSHRGHLSNHLAQLGKHGQTDYIRQGCEVVTYELVQTESDTVSITDYIDGVTERRKRREADQARQAAEFRRDKALYDLKRIQKEFPDLVAIP